MEDPPYSQGQTILDSIEFISNIYPKMKVSCTQRATIYWHVCRKNTYNRTFANVKEFLINPETYYFAKR